MTDDIKKCPLGEECVGGQGYWEHDKAFCECLPPRACDDVDNRRRVTQESIDADGTVAGGRWRPLIECGHCGHSFHLMRMGASKWESGCDYCPFCGYVIE